MKEIRTDIEIDAPAQRVWHILTGFASFPQWNSFIPQATGEARVGARLEVRIQSPGSRGMTFRPTVLRAEPNRELRWLGRLWMPGLFDGEHVSCSNPSDRPAPVWSSGKPSGGYSFPFFSGG
jgi:hypothetical protein